MKLPDLKAPFPYFGGKRAVADLVWTRLGDVDNYIEGFLGSGAVLLCRPHPPKIETVNDLDCMVANFWRATQRDPEAVVEHCDWPVNEADLHARHRQLVLSDEAKAFRKRMRRDPEYFDPKFAGWWVWGLCLWIGGGWCQTRASAGWAKRPTIASPEGGDGKGVHRAPPTKRVALAGHSRRHRGIGVHKVSADQLPMLSQALPEISGDADASGRGVHASGEPKLWNGRGNGGSHNRGIHRPQLGDGDGTCAQRRAWLLDWFGRLRDRFRTVRVCCGDWRRVCSSDSVTTRLGTTGVFLDPPYSIKAGRNMELYAEESGDVAHEARAWCLEWGPKPGMRIALCGYAGEGHEELEAAGWDVVPWRAHGGYGNRGDGGNQNAAKERLWFSPGCEREASLYDALGAGP